MSFKPGKYILVSLLFLLPAIAKCQTKAEIFGKWTLIPDSSAHVFLYRTVSLRIKDEGSHVKIIRKWGHKYARTDSLYLATNGSINSVPVNNRVWPTSVMLAVSMIPGSNEKVTAHWVRRGKDLQVNETYPVLDSQGQSEVHSHSTYKITNDGENLVMTVRRDSRPGQPLRYTFRRAAIHHAWYMRLANNWEMKGLLPQNAFLISLQGLANTDHPNLYFIYPDKWDFNFSPGMFHFYENKFRYAFTRLNSPEQALKTFHKYVKGYVVWDQNERSSLIVAFTLAGLKRAVVVSPDMIPLMKKYGIPEVGDFRGTFEGMNDAQIFSWAYNHYWDQCNKHYVIWMGGVSGNSMQPGIADFGVAKKIFFADLATVPKDTAEYALSNKIFSHMKPLSIVMGWHDYGKDLERNFVSLASHYALRVKGLNTFPDLSFISHTPPSPGFKFKNHHNIVPGKKYIPKKKVYIACIQTDGLGLGAWSHGGRGSVPYAWEVFQYMSPTVVEYFYSTATKNDYFIGALSGPGYLYPKAVPKKYLPAVIKRADQNMHLFDLNVFETMDYSQGTTLFGNTNLPKYVIDDYYKYMPDAIGFVNGYKPSHTFFVKDGKPFMSFDYYLDEHCPVSRAVDDLKELANLNKKRPYFLLMHVREWNNVDRVKKILDQLGPDFEVVPLDVFLKMAGNDPTFKNRVLEQK